MQTLNCDTGTVSSQCLNVAARSRWPSSAHRLRTIFIFLYVYIHLQSSQVHITCLWPKCPVGSGGDGGGDAGKKAAEPVTTVLDCVSTFRYWKDFRIIFQLCVPQQNTQFSISQHKVQLIYWIFIFGWTCPLTSFGLLIKLFNRSVLNCSPAVFLTQIAVEESERCQNKEKL